MVPSQNSNPRQSIESSTPYQYRHRVSSVVTDAYNTKLTNLCSVVLRLKGEFAFEVNSSVRDRHKNSSVLAAVSSTQCVCLEVAECP